MTNTDKLTRKELNEAIQEEIDKERKKANLKRGIKLFIKTIIIIFILTTLFYTYTTYISTVRIIVREYRNINEKLPDNFNSLKIIQISDLHYGSTMNYDDLIKIKKLVNERKPDIIVFTGDLIYKNKKLTTKEQEKLIKELKSLNAKLGKYAVNGNEDNENTNTILTHSNFTLLNNDYDLIYRKNNNPILLVGIDSMSNKPDINKAFSYFNEDQHNSNIYNITIFHEPDLTDEILKVHESDLLLAGHSHNGNIRLPIIKYTPFKVSNATKYDQDYYKINNSELYISSGLGTTSGVRLFCRPSINFFRLSNK